MCSAACTAPSERADDDSPVAETSSFAVYAVAVAAADPTNDAEEAAGDAGIPADPTAAGETAASATEPTTTTTATAEATAAEAKNTGEAMLQAKQSIACTLLNHCAGSAGSTSHSFSVQ